MVDGITFRGEQPPNEPSIVTFDLDGSKTFAEGPNLRTLGPLATSNHYFTAIEQMGFMIDRIQQRGKFIDGIGIATTADVQNGTIINTRRLGRTAWEGSPLVDDVASETGVSADRIVLLHEHEAGLIAEQAARPDEALGLFINIGRTFGGGLYSCDKLRDDPLAPNVEPAELGHHFLRQGAICPCGKRGCIEAFVTSYGLRHSTKLDVDKISPDDRVWNHFKIDLADAMTDTLNRYHDDRGQYIGTVSVFGSLAKKGPDVLASLHGNLLPKLGKNTPEIIRSKHGAKSAIIGVRLAVKRLLAQ